MERNMSDLIERQDAIDRIKRQMERPNSVGQWAHNDKIAKVCYRIVIEILERLPSAEPEIIRCRNCKWSEIDDPAFPNQYYCDWHDIYNEGEHWCSNGERAKG